MIAVISLLNRFIPFLTLSLAIFFFAQPSLGQSATNNTLSKRLQTQALQKALHKHPYWLALGHYHSGDSEQEVFDSYTDDPKFFLSPQGAHSPKQELLATIDALFENNIAENQHAQCRFVARMNWLKQQLNISDEQLPQIHCPNYQAWRKTINAEAVTLIFASHYVNSPSSMYGHTLLRIDPPKNEQTSEWLSYAVNFGANITTDDNSLVYAWRGLTGGYPGNFSIEPYYKKIKVYSNMENRGLWEYKLNLNPEEVERLITHLWELNTINFDYYFFSENCSFRLLELLEIARPGTDLTSTFTIKAIPTDTVREVKEQSFIDSAEYRMANIEKLKFTIKKLNQAQQNLAYELSHDTSLLNSEMYKQTVKDKEAEILYVAYNYLRYLQRKVARDKAMAKRSHQLLIAISQLDTSYTPPKQKPIDPITGHKTDKLALGLGSHADEDYAEIQLRASYHDLLDPAPGYPVGLGIEMFGLTARQWSGGHSSIENINLVTIDALTLRDQFFKGFSWRANVGAERIYNEEGDQLAPNTNASGGYTWPLSDHLNGYGLVSVRYEHNDMFSDKHQVAAGGSLGLISRYNALNAQLELGGYELSNGVERSKISAKLDYAIHDNHALRLSFERMKEASYRENNIQLSYHLFY